MLPRYLTLTDFFLYNFPATLLYVGAYVRYHYHISIQCIPKTFTRSP